MYWVAYDSGNVVEAIYEVNVEIGKLIVLQFSSKEDWVGVNEEEGEAGVR